MTATRTTELSLTPDALVAQINSQRIDFYTIHQIERLMYSPLAGMFQMPIVLDLSRVGKIPRLIMQILFRTLEKIKDEKGQRFILAGLNEDENIQGDITWFRLRFEIFDTVDQALESLSLYSWRNYKPSPKVETSHTTTCE